MAGGSGVGAGGCVGLAACGGRPLGEVRGLGGWVGSGPGPVSVVDDRLWAWLRPGRRKVLRPGRPRYGSVVDQVRGVLIVGVAGRDDGGVGVLGRPAHILLLVVGGVCAVAL